MANFMSNPSQKAQLGYNGFDLSHLLKFTSTTGELRPIYKDLLSPGDKVTCNVELKTRTKDIQSSAMCNIVEYVDWFFVPMKQIYSAFENFYYRVGHPNSSLMDDSQTAMQSSLPYVTGQNLLLSIYALANSTDWYFNGIKGTSLRLLDDLGVPASYIARLQAINNKAAIQDLVSLLSFTPIFLNAYQKIYHDYYMLEDRESIFSNSWNLDAYWSSGTISVNSFKDMCWMRYRPYKKDFFTHLFVSPLIGSESIGSTNMGNPDTYSLYNQWLTHTEPETVNNIGVADYEKPTTLTDLSEGFSPDSFRTSFALQKLLEVTRRSGNNYDAQTLAHFGVNVPEGLDGKVIFLGCQKNAINIGDVISTASTDSANLGTIGGKGYGFVNGKPIKFEAKSHGILMAIYSAVPDIDYDDTRSFDKLNLYLNRADWFTPEFDNLGMQPLFRAQSTIEKQDDVDASGILGWQYRWSELKAKYNRVTGGLAKGRGLDFWTLQRRFADDAGDNSAPLNYFICTPNSLDPIMYANYNFYNNATWSQPGTDPAYESDPLFHECYFDVKKASKMSTYGLQTL